MSPAASWLVLIVAGLFEVGWAIGVKYARVTVTTTDAAIANRAR